jgi:hypothetical protein
VVRFVVAFLATAFFNGVRRPAFFVVVLVPFADNFVSASGGAALKPARLVTR